MKKGLISLVILVLSSSAVAAEISNNRADWHITAYQAIWMESNLVDVIPKTLSADLTFKGSRFSSLSVMKKLHQFEPLKIPFTGLVIDHILLELEGQLVKHSGKQDNFESTFAFIFRTSNQVIFNWMQVNFGIGDGFSVAHSRPDFEKGPNGKHEDQVYLQNHIIIELEFSHPKQPSWSLVSRIHHRSGIYGLISPQKTGSNFLAIGLRKAF